MTPTFLPAPFVLRRLGTITLSLATAALPRLARAQRETFTNTNAWFIISGDVAIDRRWGILFDASARRSGPVRQAMANFVRGGLAYEVTDNVRIAVGANWARSYPYGDAPSDYAVNEWRTWEQAVVSHSIGRLDVSHRYRMEQRWRGKRNDPDIDHVDYWERSSRFRYQAKGTLPLSGDGVDPGEAYVSLSNEFFVAWGGKSQNVSFDQDRATVVLGYRMNRNWRTEAGFLEHVIFKSSGLEVERNHTFTFGLSYSRSAPRPAAPPNGGTASP